ncbi:MAG: AEC family transporter [Alphaproteobacteria bacterium]|jgi:malonate transporter and related proteins|nr:AEC family transporter [Rhodospirillaceae bacterium]MBT6203890.1 AEC family transporter [Rhodospirillaceae bacterium]MBT7612175.1 AEC family transporter [Rhodospirillaceae bacterium]MBT7648956.1 AEC family transporter [Rhodospirillaceae bacterium]MDG2479992.1 AEC family transporter [Alphaproteobacteria bacterium]
MTATFMALTPIFLVIVMGIGLRRWLVPDLSFWRSVERLTYFVLFPSLLLHRLMTTQLPTGEVVSSIFALVLPAVAVAVLLLLLRPRLGMSGRDFPSFLMGSIRFNSYAGLAAASALYGDDGLALFALLLAIYVPTLNVISTGVLARYAGEVSTTPLAVMYAIVTNPIIIACIAGITFNLVGLRLPLVLDRTLAILGDAALGFGLISVGAALQVESLRLGGRTIAAASVIKLLVLPVLAAVLCVLFGVEGISRGIVVLFAALPCSPAAYVLARQMGGNAELMAGIITGTTAAAILTMPIIQALLG